MFHAYSPEEVVQRRATILRLHSEGKSIRAIKSLTNLGLATVHRDLQYLGLNTDKRFNVNVNNSRQLSSASAQSVPTQQQSNSLFDTLKGKPFYCWQPDDCGCSCDCGQCFNHYIGLPRKGDVEYPLFAYEQQILQALEEHRHLFILKATGLGITELFLRDIAWRCLTNDDWKGKQVVIVTGPNLDLAIKLIRRIKDLFNSDKLYAENNTVQFDDVWPNKKTVVELNGCTVEAFPSNHVSSFRSLVSPAFIYLSESDFFGPSQELEVRNVVERYIGKSNPYIVLESTPNEPNGLMQQIELEEPSIYHKLKLPYTVGINKIYNAQEIQVAQLSHSFEREYNLKYLGMVGNAFLYEDIQFAVEQGKLRYQEDISNNNFMYYSRSEVFPRSIGIDWGAGSSKTAIIVTQQKEGMIEVIWSKTFERPMQSEILQIVVDLYRRYTNSRVYCDASAPSAIKELKYLLHDFDYNEYGYINDLYTNDYKNNNVTVYPVNFSKCNRQMLEHLNKVLMDQELLILPVPDTEYIDLITSLKSARVKSDRWELDKPNSQHNDLLDALRLNLIEYGTTIKADRPVLITERGIQRW